MGQDVVLFVRNWTLADIRDIDIPQIEPTQVVGHFVKLIPFGNERIYLRFYFVQFLQVVFKTFLISGQHFDASILISHNTAIIESWANGRWCHLPFFRPYVFIISISNSNANTTGI